MMDEQRERARRHYRGGDAAEMADVYRTLLSGIDPHRVHRVRGGHRYRKSPVDRARR